MMMLEWSLSPHFVDVDQMTELVTAVTGSTERLSCSAVGRPAPRVVWYKDDVPLTVDSEQTDDVTNVDGRNLVKTTHQLVLGDLLPADSGRYRCTAHNAYGNVTFVYTLLVIGQILSNQSCAN